MKRKILLLVLLAVAAVLFVFSGKEEAPTPQAPMMRERTSLFSGMPPFLNLTFAYPEGWKISVSRSRASEEGVAQMIGPRDQNFQFSVSFAVIGKKKTGAIALENEAEGLLERNKSLAQFKIVSKGPAQVAGQAARRVAFDFVISLPVSVPEAPSVAMREEVILISRGDLLYQIHFVGTLEQYRKNRILFENFLRSLRFTK
ncbi:MAG TPA: hypothetical protein PLL75_00690 [Candidatus Omnitrophota bacterium]|nr:hypothetical protein [Candidatus Omnitrophota bacterium]HPS36231.1 hypothetical protein [Candidatus Omnitrophota bacterium]